MGDQSSKYKSERVKYSILSISKNLRRGSVVERGSPLACLSLFFIDIILSSDCYNVQFVCIKYIPSHTEQTQRGVDFSSFNLVLIGRGIFLCLMSQQHRQFHNNGGGGSSSSVGLWGQYNDTTFTKIFVGGLAWDTQRHTLKRYFEQFGEILEAVVITDKTTGRSKGYGFVSPHSPFSFLE